MSKGFGWFLWAGQTALWILGIHREGRPQSARRQRFNMEVIKKEYMVLGQDAEESGSLCLAICENFAELDGVMRFSSLEKDAAFQNLPSPSSFGFQYFRDQLPVTEIFPIAVLEYVETDFKK